MADNQQSFSRIRESTDNSSNVATSDLVYQHSLFNSTVLYHSQSTFTLVRHKETSSSAPKIESASLPCSKKEKYQVDFHKNFTEFLPQAWVPLTKWKHTSIFKKWGNFCNKRSANTLHANEMMALKILTEEYQRGFYSNYLISYISALRNYLHDTVLNAHVIRKLMKGIFRLRPHKTKYHAI